MTAFATLTESEQVTALTELAGRALGAWGLDGADLSLIKYRENAVFRVKTGGGAHYVLRVHRPNYRSDDMIRSEFAWTRALDEAGISTPAPVTTRDDDLLTHAYASPVPEPRQCDLISWVDGAPPGTLEGGVTKSAEVVTATYFRVGELAARIQNHGESWTRPAGFARPRWDIEALVGDRPAFGPFWELEGLSANERNVLLTARERTRERLKILGEPKLLLHGDLLPDNILIDGDVLRVIDFDDCGWSWPGLELATAVFPLLVSGSFDEGLAGYLEGYASVRRFPEHELEVLPDLLVARGLSYLGWPVGRPEIQSVRAAVPQMISAVVEGVEAYLAGS